MTDGKARMHTRSRAARRGARPSRSRKLKKTFSLSAESVTFLQRLAESYNSDSEALEALLREKEREAEKQRVDAAITRYYDTLSEEEQAENEAWGKFVHDNLVPED